MPQGKLVGREGIIPVPPDWQDALQFDFASYDPNADPPWVRMGPVEQRRESEPVAHLNQMLFAKPLSEQQMGALSQWRWWFKYSE